MDDNLSTAVPFGSEHEFIVPRTPSDGYAATFLPEEGIGNTKFPLKLTALCYRDMYYIVLYDLCFVNDFINFLFR